MMLICDVAPLAGRGGRGDGDTALLLLLHPVHGGGAFMDFADLVGPAGVIEDALGRGGLTGIDVRHDADISHFLEWNRACHKSVLLIVTNGNGRMPYWLRPYGEHRPSS